MLCFNVFVGRKERENMEGKHVPLFQNGKLKVEICDFTLDCAVNGYKNRRNNSCKVKAHFYVAKLDKKQRIIGLAGTLGGGASLIVGVIKHFV